MEPLVIYGCDGERISYLVAAIVYCSISFYENLLWPQWRTALLQLTIYRHVLDRLFDSFSDESLSDVDDRNNNDVGELSDQAGGKTDTDSGSIFDGYSDISNDECDGVNVEDELRTVLPMLHDAQFHFC